MLCSQLAQARCIGAKRSKMRLLGRYLLLFLQSEADHSYSNTSPMCHWWRSWHAGRCEAARAPISRPRARPSCLCTISVACEVEKECAISSFFAVGEEVQSWPCRSSLLVNSCVYSHLSGASLHPLGMHVGRTYASARGTQELFCRSLSPVAFAFTIGMPGISRCTCPTQIG